MSATPCRACERPSARAAIPARREAALDRGVGRAETRAGRAAARVGANIATGQLRGDDAARNSTIALFYDANQRTFVGARRGRFRFVTTTTQRTQHDISPVSSAQRSAKLPPAAMVAVKAASNKTVSAQPGSAGSNPFSTVNVSPFLWCVPARPRRANPSRAFSPRAPSKSLCFYDTWDRTARDRGGANARAPAPRRRAPRLGIRARVSTRSTALERIASPRDRRASPAPRPRRGPLRTSAHADAPLPRRTLVCSRKISFRENDDWCRPSRASPLTSPCCYFRLT